MLILHGLSLSPFVRKAMLCLEHKDLAYQHEPTFPGTATEEFTAISPLRKVPALVDEGFAIADSSIICRYVEDAHGGPALYPEDVKQRAQACFLEEYADTRMVEACAPLFVQRVVRPVLMQQPTDQEVVQNALDNLIPQALSYLEHITPQEGFMFGGALSIADLALGSVVRTASLGDYQVDASAFPRFAAYSQRVLSTPLFVERLEREDADIAQLTG